MGYSEEIQQQLDNIVEQGKKGKQEVEGHTAVTVVYREHGMEGAALLVEQKVAKLVDELDWLKREWKRLKKVQDELPY